MPNTGFVKKMKKNSPIPTIGPHRIGRGKRCFLIAEAGVNHNGSPHRAMRLVKEAARAGADAIKFQTFKTTRLTTKSARTAFYQRDGTGGEMSQAKMLKKLELPLTSYRSILSECQRQGILFLSTPFDESSADFLDDLGICAFKISSGDLTNLPFLSYVAKKKKPMILSTGMATLAEVRAGVHAVRMTGNKNLVLLHCVSAYPTEPKDVNLMAMETLRKTFHVPVGFSDHTKGIVVSLSAVALGATILEKHFTLDRALTGPDQKISIIPDELRALSKGIGDIHLAMGDGVKKPVIAEKETAGMSRRSLVAKRDLVKGEVLNHLSVDILRPGTGLSPDWLPKLIGRRVNRNVDSGSLLRLEWFR